MFGRFGSDCRGTSAVEFALAAPMLSLVLLGIANGWSSANNVVDMRGAVKNGANYVLKGGTDLAATKQAVMSVWQHRTASSTVTTSYQCTCASVANDCTSLCPDGVSVPKKSIVITASTPVSFPFLQNPDPWTVSQTEVIRVR